MRGACRIPKPGSLLIMEIDIGYSFFIDILSALRNRRVADVRLCGMKHSAENSFWRPP